jgi:hypothetical protein
MINMLINPGITIVMPKNDTIFDSTLVSGLLSLFGVMLGFSLYRFDNYLKEKDERNRYEFLVLTRTIGLLERSESEIDDFFHELNSDLRAQKLGSFILMISTLSKAKKHEDLSSERREINNRLNRLKQGGRLSRIKSKFKAFCNLFSRSPPSLPRS